jgi:hypothetical protein
MSESGVNPWAQNPHGKATGLIQFMPKTLVGMGWTAGPDAFKVLTAEAQMPYVHRYLAPWKKYGLGSAGRLYQATFRPGTLLQWICRVDLRRERAARMGIQGESRA